MQHRLGRGPRGRGLAGCTCCQACCVTLGWLLTLSGPSEGNYGKPHSPKGLMGTPEQGCGV